MPRNTNVRFIQNILRAVLGKSPVALDKCSLALDAYLTPNCMGSRPKRVVLGEHALLFTPQGHSQFQDHKAPGPSCHRHTTLVWPQEGWAREQQHTEQNGQPTDALCLGAAASPLLLRFLSWSDLHRNQLWGRRCAERATDTWPPGRTERGQPCRHSSGGSRKHGPREPAACPEHSGLNAS